jgi:nucleoid-associated protein EbfC
MQQLLAAAAAMQNQLMNAQQELADATVEGTAGGGLIKAVVSGQGELLDLTISPAAFDADDPAESAQILSDLVLAAIRDASTRAADLQQQAMSPFAAGFGGAGVPGLGEMFGGPGALGAGQAEPDDDDEYEYDEPDDESDEPEDDAPGEPGGPVSGT